MFEYLVLYAIYAVSALLLFVMLRKVTMFLIPSLLQTFQDIKRCGSFMKYLANGMQNQTIRLLSSIFPNVLAFQQKLEEAKGKEVKKKKKVQRPIMPIVTKKHVVNTEMSDDIHCKLILCPFEFTENMCNRGNYCNYYHPYLDCADFLKTGKCKDDNNCKQNHSYDSRYFHRTMELFVDTGLSKSVVEIRDALDVLALREAHVTILSEQIHDLENVIHYLKKPIDARSVKV